MKFQWGIFIADLDPVVGREQGKRRPVLVVSAEPLNEAYDVVMIVPITSRKEERPARIGEVLLAAGIGGLRQESFALCYQARAIDKQRMTDYWGTIDEEPIRQEIASMLSWCLDLEYV